jgi:quercetin dioxygenase-like cupin family protein
MIRILSIALLLVLCSSTWARDTNTALVETLAKSGTTWTGAPLPAYATGTPEVTVLKITLPPGVALPMHQHPFMNAGILLSGELTVYAESGEIKHLKAGEALIELVNAWHYGSNEGDVPAEILVVYAGIAGEPVSIRKDVASPAH